MIHWNEYGCRDGDLAKNRGNMQGIPLAIQTTIKDTSTIMRNPLPELCREGLSMIWLA